MSKFYNILQYNTSVVMILILMMMPVSVVTLTSVVTLNSLVTLTSDLGFYLSSLGKSLPLIHCKIMRQSKLVLNGTTLNAETDKFCIFPKLTAKGKNYGLP